VQAKTRHIEGEEMRKSQHYRAVLLGAMVLGLSKPALAEDASPAPAAKKPEPEPRYWWHRRHQVQADLGLGVIGLAYEYMFEQHVALQVEANVFGTWFGPIVDLPNFRGLGGQVRPTIFLNRNAPEGIYVAPYLRMARVSGEENGLRGTGIGWSIGTWIGYSLLFLDDRVNLRLGAGLQYMNYGVDIPTGSLRPVRQEFSTLFPAIDLVVGYRF